MNSLNKWIHLLFRHHINEFIYWSDEFIDFMNSSISSILFVNSSNQKFLLNEFIRFLDREEIAC